MRCLAPVDVKVGGGKDLVKAVDVVGGEAQDNVVIDVALAFAEGFRKLGLLLLLDLLLAHGHLLLGDLGQLAMPALHHFGKGLLLRLRQHACIAQVLEADVQEVLKVDGRRYDKLGLGRHAGG